MDKLEVQKNQFYQQIQQGLFSQINEFDCSELLSFYKQFFQALSKLPYNSYIIITSYIFFDKFMEFLDINYVQLL
ncbi:hypothetical protein pb186bvf_004486 [Paramecium bursaria]